MPVHIDSKEVLQHLKNYGIDSIDDSALKSFIKGKKIQTLFILSFLLIS